MLDPLATLWLLSDRNLEELGIRKRSTAQKDRVNGTGIPFIRVGGLVRYRKEDVERYLAELPTRRSTSKPKGATWRASARRGAARKRSDPESAGSDCRVENFEKQQPPSFTANFRPRQRGEPRARRDEPPLR